MHPLPQAVIHHARYDEMISLEKAPQQCRAGCDTRCDEHGICRAFEFRQHLFRLSICRVSVAAVRDAREARGIVRIPGVGRGRNQQRRHRPRRRVDIVICLRQYGRRFRRFVLHAS